MLGARPSREAAIVTSLALKLAGLYRQSSADEGEKMIGKGWRGGGFGQVGGGGWGRCGVCDGWGREWEAVTNGWRMGVWVVNGVLIEKKREG